VLTYNVYLGASLSRVLKARSLHDLKQQVENIALQVEENDFVARAYALAEIARVHRPDVISLQEVALWRGDRDGGGMLDCHDASQVKFDFLAILLNALTNHGLAYQVASVAENEDIEAPTLTRGDLRLTDRNVILVAEHVELLDHDSGHFDAQRSRSFLGFTLSQRKGWVSALLKKDGRVFRVINPHLELVDPYRAEQVDDLLDMVDATPTILAGDFNTNPELSKRKRKRMKSLGVRDIGIGGLPTCCQDKSLRNSVSRLKWRPDLILTSKHFERVRAIRVGGRERSARNKRQRMWISDHAGVFGVVRLTP